MKKFLTALLMVGFAAFGSGTINAADSFSCGPGYILASHNDVDDIDAAECQKLWCRDLETGDVMGNGERANNGYKSTSYPIELCDADGTCIECFGDRVWCDGQAPGIWNPEYGAYTYNGSDDAMHTSYKKGGCFAWNTTEISCPIGQIAVLDGDEWVCATPSAGNVVGDRGSTIRRTSTTTLRRAIR